MNSAAAAVVCGLWRLQVLYAFAIFQYIFMWKWTTSNPSSICVEWLRLVFRLNVVGSDNMNWWCSCNYHNDNVSLACCVLNVIFNYFYLVSCVLSFLLWVRLSRPLLKWSKLCLVTCNIVKLDIVKRGWMHFVLLADCRCRLLATSVPVLLIYG